MLGTINLNLCPFAGKLVIPGSSQQHITLNARRKQIIYKAGSKQKHRILFTVCKFMGETIQANATKPIDLERLQPVLQKWLDGVCAISFKTETTNQSGIEIQAINDGKRAVLEGLGLNQSNYVSHEEDTSPTPSEELVTASELEPVAEPVEPTTKTFTLPISSQKAVTLTIPIDLTKDEAELIANSSLEYLKALLLSQYKE
ncbi:hypothetical protein EJ576_21720 [Pseudomonas sp. C 49-2]|uniref:hypothetical protein n=1 Tax=Pseudomonas sp. C 49-2 TaxID=2496849 RepID=UPI000F81F8B3|nr:hypothetical protein [Pseudomonas sp. C 49-2]RTX96346.1 hypothetical protein EJ576_21720 [Pseudomonas sp. C 49-2]